MIESLMRVKINKLLCTYISASISTIKPYGSILSWSLCFLNCDRFAVCISCLVFLSYQGCNRIGLTKDGLSNFRGNPVLSAFVWLNSLIMTLISSSQFEKSACLAPRTKFFFTPDQIDPRCFTLAIFCNFRRLVSGLYLKCNQSNNIER